MAESTHNLKLVIEAVNHADATLRGVVQQVQGLDTAVRGHVAGFQAMGTALNGAFAQMGSVLASSTRTFQGQLDPLRTTLDQVGIAAAGATSKLASMGGIAGTIAVALPIVAGLGVAGAFLAKSLADASQETQNMMQLQAGWTALNRGSREEMDAFVDSVKALSRTSSYASQDVVGAAKYLAGFAKIGTDELLPTLQVVIDTASYMGVNIMQAAQIVGYAARGEMGMLREWGFSFSAATLQSRSFSDILREIGERVAGQEAAKMNTYAGAVGMVTKAFNRVEKAVGRVIEAASIPVLKDLAAYFGELGSKVEAAFKAGATEEWQAKIQAALQKTAEFVKRAVEGIVEFAESGGLGRLIEGMLAVASAIQMVAVAAGKLLKFFLELPTPVLAVLAGLLGFKIVAGIVKSIWTAFTALIGKIVAGTAAIRGYMATTLPSLTAEKVAVDAVTASYLKRNVAAAGTTYIGPGHYSGGRTTGGGARDVGSWVPGTAKKGGDIAKRVAIEGGKTAAGMGAGAGLYRLVAGGPMVGIRAAGVAVGRAATAIGGSAVAAGAALAAVFAAPILATMAIIDYKWKAQKAALSPDYDAEDLVESYQTRIAIAASQGEEFSEIQKRLRQEIEDGVKAGIIDGNTRIGIEEALTDALGRELDAIKERNKALEEMGKDPSAASGDLFGDAKNEKMITKRSKEMEESITRFYQHQNALDDNAVALQKANISATAKSRRQAADQIEQLDLWAANQRIARAEDEYAQKVALLEAEKAKRIAIEPKNEGIIEEEINKRMIAVDQARSKSYEAELQKRTQSLQKHIDEVKNLEEELFKVQQANQEGLVKLREGTLTESEKLNASVDAMHAKFEQAVALLPTMPERAKSLFQEAQQQAQALAQQIKSLEDNLKGISDSFKQSFQAMAKLGKGPQFAFQMDVAGVKKSLAEATAALGQGEYGEAQKKAEAARQKIDSLVSQAEQLYGPEQAKQMLTPLLKEAQVIAETAGGGQLDRAKDIQTQAEGTYKQAGAQIEGIISRQIETLRQQMSVEERLIEALRGLAAQIGGKAGAIPEGLSGQSSPTAGAMPEVGLPPAAVSEGIGSQTGRAGMSGFGIFGSAFTGDYRGMIPDLTGASERAMSAVRSIAEQIVANVSGKVEAVSESMKVQRKGYEGETEPADLLQAQAENTKMFGRSAQEINEASKRLAKPIEIKVTVNQSGQASAEVWA